MPTKLQILQDHCTRFEVALARCAVPEEAVALKEQACAALMHSCGSEMLQGLLDEHAQALIRRRFEEG